MLAGAWPPCLGMGTAIVLLGFMSTRLANEALESSVELPTLPWLFMTMAALLVLAMGFVVWASLRISHRVVGPTFNMRRVFGQVHAGDLSVRVRLREGDYLHGVADLINEHLQWLQQHPPTDVTAGEAETQAPAEEEMACSATGATGSPRD